MKFFLLRITLRLPRAGLRRVAARPHSTRRTIPTAWRNRCRPVPVHIGQATLHTEIASTPREGEIGLMYRRSMPDNDGMLFVLPEGTATFWMKNTLIPLSIAFLDKNGTILELHDMKAMDETITRSDSDHVAYAIEANLHWFDLNGIKPGMKIDPSPSAILKEAAAHATAD